MTLGIFGLLRGICVWPPTKLIARRVVISETEFYAVCAQ